jgi:hypothetical protein
MFSKTELIKQKWICTYVNCGKINKTNERRNHRWNSRPVATWHVIMTISAQPQLCVAQTSVLTDVTSGAVWPWVTERSVMCWDMHQSTDKRQTGFMSNDAASASTSEIRKPVTSRHWNTRTWQACNNMTFLQNLMIIAQLNQTTWTRWSLWQVTWHQFISMSLYWFVETVHDLLCASTSIKWSKTDRCLRVKISNDFSSCTKLSQFPIRMWFYILFERFPLLLMGKFLVITYSRQHCKGRSEGAAKPLCTFCALRLRYLGGTLRRHTSFS